MQTITIEQPKPRWRYRTDWRGRLILQIRPPIAPGAMITVGEAAKGQLDWRDARAEDITERVPVMIVRHDA